MYQMYVLSFVIDFKFPVYHSLDSRFIACFSEEGGCRRLHLSISGHERFLSYFYKNVEAICEESENIQENEYI